MEANQWAGVYPARAICFSIHRGEEDNQRHGVRTYQARCMVSSRLATTGWHGPFRINDESDKLAYLRFPRFRNRHFPMIRHPLPESRRAHGHHGSPGSGAAGRGLARSIMLVAGGRPPLYYCEVKSAT
jgi:hypothetical protein